MALHQPSVLQHESECGLSQCGVIIFEYTVIVGDHVMKQTKNTEIDTIIKYALLDVALPL